MTVNFRVGPRMRVRELNREQRQQDVYAFQMNCVSLISNSKKQQNYGTQISKQVSDLLIYMTTALTA